MKRCTLLTAIMIAVFALAGCGEKAGEEAPMEEGPKVVEEAPEMEEAVEYVTKRILYVRENGVPGEYKGRENPLEATEENIKRGKELYRAQCSMCHGQEGRGDTPAGRSLTPQASDLPIIMGMPEATDGYLFWAISEGGIPLKTPMIPFKNTFSEEDRWKIILYEKTFKAE